MTEGKFKDVFEHALSMSARDRAALADVLDESLQDVEADLSPEWKAEIARRIAAVERGESRLIPADEVEARIHASLARL